MITAKADREARCDGDDLFGEDCAFDLNQTRHYCRVVAEK